MQVSNHNGVFHIDNVLTCNKFTQTLPVSQADILLLICQPLSLFQLKTFVLRQTNEIYNAMPIT